MEEITTNVDDLGFVRDNVNQVTEEAVQRVQAQSKQSKQIAQQIKKDKAVNNQLASFLSYLMKEIENEELTHLMVNTFFKTTNPRNQITYLRKDINTYVIVGFFVPFFLKKAEELKIIGFYDKIGAASAGSDLNNYITYLGKLSDTYHDNIPIDQGPLINLICLIAQIWIFKDKEKTLDVIKQDVAHALYGS